MIFSSRLFRKIFLSAVVLTAAVVLVVNFYVASFIRRTQAANVAQRLEAQARILASETSRLREQDLQAWARSAAERANARVTVIHRSGEVLAESGTTPDSMQPHAERPEVREALSGRVGSSIRRSETLGRDYCYVAYPLGNRDVLRLAVPLIDLDRGIKAARSGMIGVSILAAGLALLIAFLISRTITGRIRRIQLFAARLLDPDSPKELAPDSDDELGQLASTISRMAAQLRELIDKLHLESSRLERVERVRKDFVANVSHELRTPLTAIRGYAETLLDGALEDGQNNRRFLEIIKAHTIRLNNIASDLLTLSELESGLNTSEPEAVSVRAVLETALRTVEAQARIQNVHLVSGTIEDFEVMGYRIRLEQALVNLLDNAVKFNKPGGEVRIESTRALDGSGFISVSDTGVGIPAEDLMRIFERFYRVDRARSREVGGTGLGLSIVKHVVERMNGSVTVVSEVGTGSTFTIKLPCSDLEAPAKTASPMTRTTP